jgi:ABC-type multidrug transport system fused ATPase/permease subunit
MFYCFFVFFLSCIIGLVAIYWFDGSYFWDVLLIFVLLFFCVFIFPGLIGLAVIYGLSLNIQQSQWVWCLCDVENTIIAVERVQQYMGIPSEAPLLIQESHPPRDWPTSGTIHLQDLQVSFQPKVPKNSSVLPVSSTIEREILSCFRNTCVIVNSVLGV